MPRVTHRDFSLGLWLQSDRDGVPRNALRQARAIAPLRDQQIKSRWGSIRTASLTQNAGTIIHYANYTLLQVGTDLGTLVGAAYGSLGYKPLGGGRLRACRGVPTTQTQADAFPITTDHLFVAGGGVNNAGNPAGAFGARKLNDSLQDSQWGIDPPDGELTALPVDPILIPISTFDLVSNELWGEVAEIPGTLNTVHTGGHGYDSGNKITGAASFILEAFRGLTYATVAPITFDATGTATTGSGEQDWIQFWVLLEIPSAVVSLDLIFDVTSSTELPLTQRDVFSFSKLRDTYSFHFLPADISGITTDLTGSGDHPELESAAGGRSGILKNVLTNADATLHDIHTLVTSPHQALEAIFGSSGPNRYKVLSRNIAANISIATARQLNADMGTTRLPAEAHAWKLMRVPKSAFHAAGNAVDHNLWGQIRRVYFSLTANTTDQDDPPARIRIDHLALNLGYGMMGDYSYAYTYKNSLTGTRSNPNTFPDELPMVKGIQRQAVRVKGFKLPTDPQVDIIEVWRPIGNGSVFFKAEDIPKDHFTSVVQNGHLDTVADFPGMQDAGLRTPWTNPDGSFRETQFLQDEELTFDNIAIPPEVQDVVGPHLARLFLLINKIGSRGRVFYTAVGRLEAIQGFVVSTSDDDAMQRLVLWNGQVYAYSQAKLFEIAGGTQPVSTEIYGVPGTLWPHSVVPTPGGIIYRAKDGLRRFTGTTSELLAADAVLSVFLGETVTQGDHTIAPFAAASNVVAEYYGGEYWITNGTATLAVNPETKVWREIGVAAGAMLAHPERPNLLLSANNELYNWEFPAVLSDGGLPIPFVVEIPGTVLENQSGATKFVQRLYLDCNTNGQELSVVARTILHGTISLGTVMTTQREMLEISLLIVGDVLSIELSGDLTNRVEVFGCAYDYHETAGSDGSDM